MLDKRLSSNSLNLFRCIVFFTCIAALFAWSPIGYYQDEFVYRLLNARYIQDQHLRMGIYSLCESWLTAFPQFLATQAWVVSFFYNTLLPHETRVVVFVVISCFFGVIALKGRASANLYLLGAFVGVAGSSMLYSRPEFLHILNITFCFAGFLVADAKDFQGKKATKLLLAFLILTTYLISSYSHMQGILYLPLNAYCLFLLLRKHLILMFMAILIAISSSLVSYQASQQALACNNSPKVAAHLSNLSHSITDLPSVLTSEQAYKKIYWYMERFLYKGKYSVDYLPGIKLSGWLKVLNFFITSAVVINLLLALLIMLNISIQLLSQLKNKQINPFARPDGLGILTLLILGPTFFLFLINSGQTFYRNFFIHMVIVAAIAFYYSHIDKPPQAWFKFISVLFSIIFSLSLMANFKYFFPKLSQGYSGWYSIPLDVEKKFMKQTIPNSCEFDAKRGRLVVDMLSYEHLKHYPYLYPHEYIFIQSKLTGIHKKEILQTMGMQGYAFACKNQDGKLELCCGKF